MPSIDRRNFIRHAILGSGVLASGLLSGCNDGSATASSKAASFTHGVASGDPLTDRVILWARAVPASGNSLNVTWEVASDTAFSTIVSKGEANTDASRDYTVNVDASGLTAGTDYYYRFTADNVVSPVGKTRTLPQTSPDEVKLAVLCCANYPAGFFHVYAEVAKHNDLFAALHLGDYLYEYSTDIGQYEAAEGIKLGRVSVPANELLTLADYRQRYAQYRSDPDLQALHATLPFICIWDDHEVANNTWKDGAENHTPATEGDFSLRRAAAVKAWREWLPVREQDATNPLLIYRSFDFGTLLSLHMLDTRLVGRDKQLDYANYIDPITSTFDASTFNANMADPTRQLMGTEQTAWLQGQLAASTATWQLLGQQILMGKMYLPLPLLTPAMPNPTVSFAQYGVIATAFTTYKTLSAQLTAAGTPLTPANLLAAGMTAAQLTIVNDPTNQAIIAAPNIPYNLDAWDGYTVARETLFSMARLLDKNLLVVSGDSHNAWANDLQDKDGNPIGVEFATSSITSPGFEEYLPNMKPAELAANLMQWIPTLAYANTSQRGYLVLSVTATEAKANWYFVSSVKTNTYTATLEKSLTTLAGAGQRKLVRS
ncbi:alkaline phosphatase D family protein [Thiothrix lacustris]|uniref:alkaline phosphatase D family protein n=1 Tax=Thiothrix lacustris TaxID=525917 RepID=UPI0027E45B44|nr:alkaline phosphatase D family protein [Thiothrix lacustris]WMP16849.1 alkaline phosphatase D family protein [Thiothrix lacustris]